MNLSLLLDLAADAFRERVLLGPAGTGLTAAGLRRRSAEGASLIRSHGADSLVYLGTNGPAFPLALFAAARAGVPLVPVNYRLGADQLGAVLANHRGALGLADAAHVETLRDAGLTAYELAEYIGRAADQGDADVGGPAEEPERPAAIIYTSGTTAVPKGVLVHHANLLAYVLGTVEFAAADPGDAALTSVPPYHIAAVVNAITNIYAGRRAVVLERFTPTDWLDTVRAERVTTAMVVPTMLARIMDRPDTALDVPSLRTLSYGGAPMSAAVITRALHRWPHVDFVNAYGLTETSSTIAVLGPADHRAALASSDPAARTRLASAGRAVPGVEITVRDPDGTGLPPGHVGRIWVRGEQVSGEYAGAGAGLDPAGWFDTRDEGYLDSDGYLFVRGRADDTIIRGAENIAPAEIEEVLLAYPDVLDAAVVGVPDDEWGHRIEAAVVLRSAALPPAEDELRAHVRTRLRGSKTPDRIAFWPEIPRTDTGKLLRRQVLTRLLARSPAGEGPEVLHS